MDPSIPVRYSYTNNTSSHENDLVELAKDLDVEIPAHILRIWKCQADNKAAYLQHRKKMQFSILPPKHWNKNFDYQIRILVKLLAEGIHPLALIKLCKDLCRHSVIDKKT